jgi:general secretion pathway protein G
MTPIPRRAAGFTLIELIVVMLIISLLASLAVPRYFGSLEKSKNVVLKEDLMLMRDALGKYYGDHDKYPATLDDLVSRKYLRNIPPDPLTESASTWITVAPEDPDKGGVMDVHSGAEGNAANGSPYKEW